jgi:hypothetical protein
LERLELLGRTEPYEPTVQIVRSGQRFNLLSMLDAADAVGGLNLSAAAETDCNFAGFNNDRYLPAAVRVLKHSL